MVRVRYSFGSRHTGHLENIGKQRKKYPKVVEEVIRISDIILEVLDARFVNETRNIDLEERIQKKGKKIIYVLNKADLVDRDKVEKKLKIRPYVFVSCTERKGSVRLRSLIKRVVAETELPENKERAQVGIIGYPNTGKSSLLNFLTGKTSARTGNQPGFTKGLQKVRLTKNIMILDTPGVISESDYSMTDKEKIAKHTKVGSRSYSNVRNPDVIVQELLNEMSSRKKLEKFYSIDSGDDAELFLEIVGKKFGLLKKGGVIDIDRTARKVLRDWQSGDITQ